MRFRLLSDIMFKYLCPSQFVCRHWRWPKDLCVLFVCMGEQERNRVQIWVRQWESVTFFSVCACEPLLQRSTLSPCTLFSPPDSQPAGPPSIAPSDWNFISSHDDDDDDDGDKDSGIVDDGDPSTKQNEHWAYELAFNTLKCKWQNKARSQNHGVCMIIRMRMTFPLKYHILFSSSL